MEAVVRELKKPLLHARSHYQHDTSTPSPGRLVIRAAEATYIILTSEILRIEASSNYCTLHLGNGQTITTSKTLKLVSNVLGNAHFIRTHASHLVHLEAIRQVNRDGARLSDGTVVPVSRQRRSEVIDRIASSAAVI